METQPLLQAQRASSVAPEHDHFVETNPAAAWIEPGSNRLLLIEQIAARRLADHFSDGTCPQPLHDWRGQTGTIHFDRSSL